MVNFYDIMKEIEIEFFDALSSKTSWGKNEIMVLYKNVVAEVLLRRMSEQEED